MIQIWTFPADPSTERVPSLAERVAYLRHPINLRLLAPQSGAHTIAPHRDPIQPIQPNPLIALEQENPEKTHDVIYF